MQHLISEKYTTESLAKIKDVLQAHRTHEIQPVANGLFAACLLYTSPSPRDA